MVWKKDMLWYPINKPLNDNEFMNHRARNLEKLKIADLDDSMRDQWETGGALRPVFIMGLHRSGTTFLYESLATVLPVAKLTVQDIIFYPRLVNGYLKDGGESDRKVLESYFRSQQVKYRCVDSIKLSSETPEEYGWHIKRRSGSFKLSDKTLSEFKDLYQKLLFCHPESKAVLLKNPWDTSVADHIAGLIPEARFIFIRRNPLEILNSELRNALSFSARRDPLLYLLMKGAPEVKWLIEVMRIMRCVLGEKLFSSVFTKFLFSDICNNLHGYQSAINNIPNDRLIEISYRELVEDTRATLTKLAAYLELPISSDVGSVQGKRREEGFLPIIERKKQLFVDRLMAENLDCFLGA